MVFAIVVEIIRRNRAIAPTPQSTQLVAPLPPPPPSAPPALGGIISPICRTSGRERLRVSRSMTYIYQVAATAVVSFN